MEITRYYCNGKLVQTKDVYHFKESSESKEIGEMLASPRFSDMIYEDDIKEIIRLVINRARENPMNILLTGSAGTGKSSTAKLFAVELGRPFVYLNGQMGAKKIIEILTNVKENALVLFDEIHSWSVKSSEIIYPVIQDNELVTDGKIIDMKNLMFIACTTEPQEIPRPLRERFKQIELEELHGDKLSMLLEKKGCDFLTAEGILDYTSNIRIINNLLDMMDLYGCYSYNNLIKVFNLKKINIKTGLSALQEKYLEVLGKSEKPIGLRSLGLILKKSEDYIKNEIESDLIRKDLVSISGRGRTIPDKQKV